jgi:hypothetical protein
VQFQDRLLGMRFGRPILDKKNEGVAA